MALNTRVQLVALLNSNVLTGGNRTTAQGIRDFENSIIESLINHLDDVDTADGFLGIGSNGIVDVSFIKKVTSTGQFLMDDGTWQTVSTSTPSLQDVVNIDNGIEISGPGINFYTSVVPGVGAEYTAFSIRVLGLPHRVHMVAGIDEYAESFLYFKENSFPNDKVIELQSYRGLDILDSTRMSSLFKVNRITNLVTVNGAMSVTSLNGVNESYLNVDTNSGAIAQLFIVDANGTSGLMVDSVQSKMFHVIKNVFDAPLHEFNNTIKLDGLNITYDGNADGLLEINTGGDYGGISSNGQQIKLNGNTGYIEVYSSNTVKIRVSNDSQIITLTAPDIVVSQEPTLPLGVASKSYVDNYITGLSWKTSVRASSVGDISISSPLTNVIDGVTMVNGERILLKNQTTQTENGIYIWGSPLVRSTDANTALELISATVYVREGSTELNKIYSVNVSPITLGSTNITFALVNGGGTYTYGSYLKLTGNVFDIDFTTFSTTEITEGSKLFYTNARGIGSLLTGYVAAAGTVSATDSILIGIEKLDGNISNLNTTKADKQDGLFSGGAITIGTFGGTGVNNDIRVAAAVWVISLVQYSTVINTDFNDVVLAATGLQRYIGLYGDNTNAITKVEGVDALIADYPATPGGKVLLGYALVSDAGISAGSDFIGYLLKSSKATGNDLNTGTNDTLYPTSLAIQNSRLLGQNLMKISATATGTNTYSITLTPVPTAYANTQMFKVIFTNANTGASTINVNGLGAKTLVKNNGAGLMAGDIQANSIWNVAYDGTNMKMLGMVTTNDISLNKSANFTVAATEVGLTYDVTTGGSLITATLPTSYNGWYFYIRKVDSGVGTIITSTATITVERQNQIILVQFGASAWTASVIDEGFIPTASAMSNVSGAAARSVPNLVIDIHDSAQKAYNYNQNGFTKDWLSGVFYRQYKNKTVTTTSKATILSTTGGDYAGAAATALRVFANTLVAGKCIRLKQIGKYTSTNGADTLLIEIKIGTVVLTSTTPFTVGTTFTDVYYEINYEINIDAIGAAGTAIGLGKLSFITAAGVTTTFPVMDTFAAKTVDTTINNDLDMQVQHSNASGSITNILTTFERLA